MKRRKQEKTVELMEVAAQVAQQLSETLSPDCNAVHRATEALDGLSLLPQFPFSLLSIATGICFPH